MSASRALSISKGVVAKYVKAAEASGVSWAEVAAADEARLRALLGGTPRPRGTAVGYRMPDLAGVHQGLKRKNVTLALLWEEYVQATAGPTYQYSRFCDLYRDFAKGLKRSMRQVHRAGEKLFIDYAGDTVPIVDAETGEISRAQIFVAVLGASNYTFACATATQSQADWLGALGRALRFIGGVPELIVPDNTRSMVGEPDRYAPQLQRTTAEFAQHYGVAILPARPYKPQDKSKVEVGVQIVQRWILARLRHRRFFSLAELDVAIAELLEDLNARPFQRLPGNRRSAFETLEQPGMGHQDARPDLVQRMVDEAAPKTRVDRRQRRPDIARAEPRPDEFRGVGRPGRDDVALLCAARLKRRGGRSGQLAHPFPAPFLTILEPDEHLVRR